MLVRNVMSRPRRDSHKLSQEFMLKTLFRKYKKETLHPKLCDAEHPPKGRMSADFLFYLYSVSGVSLTF